MSAVLPVGSNRTRLWGLTPRERLARMAAGQQLDFASGAGGGPLVANLAFVFDPAWLRFIAERPNHVLTVEGVPVLAHVEDLEPRLAVTFAMGHDLPLADPAGCVSVAYEELGALENEALRKREKPFLGRLTPETVRALERQSYFGAYKGVTDLLTKYLWPEWALVLTRWAARIGMTPNQVTTIGALLCIAATWLFHEGHFWTGIALGLVFMVLDTVDGKLARCTLTSSWWGNVFDHGIDLVHPPFWWWAWGVGLHAWGRPLDGELFATVMAVLIGGYVVQRLIEGAFIARFRIHIHVWRPFDSWFRLITARRNPNMVILVAFLALGRPEWGLLAVAGWTIASLAVHGVQLLQAIRAARRRPVVSWLA
ncbi:CDP-alcohol phosphatidyltransferase family protein [Sphingomonas parva]|uniref:CDP-alcohol phosphatidyltransferase family protein n=1 Tax=Sphingomonas parva TaxID=2555898 RepID=A0A4Y8ZVZ8_9SPHN|nr:CDP-alcohol phosphatidyltransferase family protein [Sphingomonas parva]TFI58889.1 CDP-alcohol phosphatidyltransferase family protein [Sphingomonas parva]